MAGHLKSRLSLAANIAAALSFPLLAGCVLEPAPEGVAGPYGGCCYAYYDNGFGPYYSRPDVYGFGPNEYVYDEGRIGDHGWHGNRGFNGGRGGPGGGPAPHGGDFGHR